MDRICVSLSQSDTAANRQIASLAKDDSCVFVEFVAHRKNPKIRRISTGFGP